MWRKETSSGAKTSPGNNVEPVSPHSGGRRQLLRAPLGLHHRLCDAAIGFLKSLHDGIDGFGFGASASVVDSYESGRVFAEDLTRLGLVKLLCWCRKHPFCRQSPGFDHSFPWLSCLEPDRGHLLFRRGS